MSLAFLLLAVVVLGAAAGAMMLRNLVHCALCGALSFLGLAGTFLLLGAEFIAFAQVLVYVGAVAVLIVMVILVTRPSANRTDRRWSAATIIGTTTALLTTVALVGIVLASPALRRPLPPATAASVRDLGNRLMTQYVVPLEATGLLLTAALIGAVLIALRDSAPRPRP